MNIFDVEFTEYSIIADDPKKLDRIQNHFYDDEYDQWEKEFDAEMENPTSENPYDFSEYEVLDESKLDMPDQATIDSIKIKKELPEVTQDDDFEVISAVDADEIDDWEEDN